MKGGETRSSRNCNEAVSSVPPSVTASHGAVTLTGLVHYMCAQGKHFMRTLLMVQVHSYHRACHALVWRLFRQ